MNPHINKRSRVLPPWGHLMTASRIAFERQPPISRRVARFEPKDIDCCEYLSLSCGGLLGIYRGLLVIPSDSVGYKALSVAVGYPVAMLWGVALCLYKECQD